MKPSSLDIAWICPNNDQPIKDIGECLLCKDLSCSRSTNMTPREMLLYFSEEEKTQLFDLLAKFRERYKKEVPDDPNIGW